VVHAPPGIRVVMSAEHLSHDPARGIFRFRMAQPIPPYLMALAAGELGFEPLGARTGVYAEPAVLARATSEFRDVEKMVQAAEALYGPYAWGRWDTIVLPPSFPFGGMENPRLTFATPTIIAGDRSLVDVMAHELAHSWSGNLVTNATWSDFWLNEGFTTYIENRIVERLYGKDLAEMQVLLQIRKLRQTAAEEAGAPGDTQLAQELIGKNPDEAGDVAYEKGSSFLRVLEKHFGRERLDAFLRGYFAGNAFHSMTTGRFLELLRAGLFEDQPAAWDALRVEEWVYGRGIPDNLALPRSQRFEDTRAAAFAFVNSGSTEGVHADWLTVEWLDFLGALPKPLNRAQLEALDRKFGFTTRGNSEVLFAWLEHAVAASYEPAFPAIEHFLTSMGRRKFLKPLYEDLDANPKTRDLARRIYEKARPSYHPSAVSTIDAMLKWK
jgi:aminopeptidase N